ncbi:hypothetical protein HanLR1_Chr17g0668221 [Helianthus annuus]|nr:hypothetical protein HanHA89_Chr17g0709661 [Helianthus annuus]KAJ0632716.1 hypothetical protein HanLR1_Chr17g0668221 [Helianthus annuus]
MSNSIFKWQKHSIICLTVSPFILSNKSNSFFSKAISFFLICLPPSALTLNASQTDFDDPS